MGSLTVDIKKRDEESFLRYRKYALGYLKKAEEFQGVGKVSLNEVGIYLEFAKVSAMIAELYRENK